MQKFVISGGNKISGELNVQGAKNSALPILAASLLASDEVKLKNCPKLSDTYAAFRILSHLGCRVESEGNSVYINSGDADGFEIPQKLMKEMRSSIIFLGAILGRFGECRLFFPGGCELGPRPIDIHINALKKMGAHIHEEHGEIYCKGKLHGAEIIFPFSSVGATENVMLAATLTDGETIIKNAAREPEIKDLADFLNSMGAEIKGAGESTISIRGKEKLHPTEYKIMSDRIVAVTYLSAAVITGGDMLLKEVNPDDFDAVTSVFEEMGCKIYKQTDSIYLLPPKKIKAVRSVKTMPYPAFPTDAQAVIMAVLTKAEGTSIFVENIFENRYKHSYELAKMGADIKVEGKVAVVSGVPKLYGASVDSTDLRGGAALVLAGLSAEGETEVGSIFHIDRGYEEFEKNLRLVNARIERI